jgi:hypothetical protein
MFSRIRKKTRVIVWAVLEINEKRRQAAGATGVTRPYLNPLTKITLRSACPRDINNVFPSRVQ